MGLLLSRIGSPKDGKIAKLKQPPKKASIRQAKMDSTLWPCQPEKPESGGWSSSLLEKFGEVLEDELVDYSQRGPNVMRKFSPH